MTQPRRRRLSWMWIGLPAVLLGGLFFVLGRGPGVPAEGSTVLYPAVMLYNYAAIPLAIVMLLAASLLLVLWIPQVLRRLPRYARNGLALALALGGAALGCWGSLPRAFGVATYVHLDRATLPGRVYQLGARLGLDEDNFYVLCECPAPGLVCGCGHLREAGAPVFSERPELVTDPVSGSLSIQVGTQILWSVQP